MHNSGYLIIRSEWLRIKGSSSREHLLDEIHRHLVRDDSRFMAPV
jgi:hypothetical protein